MRQILFLLSTCLSLTACSSWLDPLPDTPANLKISVVTIALKDGPDADPVASEAEAREMVKSASALWEKRCGVSLVHRAHIERDARALGIPIDANGDEAIAQVQNTFISDNYITAVFVHRLLPDKNATGEAVAGISPLPWQDRHAQLLLRDAVGTSVYAHEIGHYIGLEHVGDDPWDETSDQDATNLMFPVDIGWPEPNLQGVQCAEVKKYLLGYESLRPLCRPDSPDSLKQDCPEPNFPTGITTTFKEALPPKNLNANCNIKTVKR